MGFFQFYSVTEFVSYHETSTPVGIKLYEKNRGKQDKRGGGLMIGYKLSNRIKLEEVKVDNIDILALEGMIENQKHRIILSYFDSNKKKSGEEYEKNRKIQKDIETLMEVEPGVKLICLGDFNGRLKKLEPDITTDTNGQMIENWSIDRDLQHLNTHEKCTGKYTFTSLNGKSAIDHVLVNNNLMNDFIEMYIDEGRIQLGISDHNLIRVWFTMKHKNTKWKNNSSKKTKKWVGKDSESLAKFEKAFENQIGKKTSFKRCIDKMKYTLNHTMRKRKKIKTSKSNNKTLLAAVWMDEELRSNIKLRSSYSRAWNLAKVNIDQPEIIEECKKRYIEQKKITRKMCNDKKSQWEEKEIKETWNNGKKFWKMIRELLEDLDIDENTYVYTAEGVKIDIQTCGKEYVTKWKEAVYQKEPKTDFSFWYGREKMTELKEIMNDKLSKGNSGIMEFPPITEKEFTEVIKQMKNGKAAGIYYIPAELMKHLIKNEKIRVYLVKCFNNAVLESVHKDWLTSKTTMIPKTKKPKILDHRPIAVTVNNSKIVCTILRTRIEEFLKESNNKFTTSL